MTVPALPFVEAAEAFAREYDRSPAFILLRRYLRCTEEELHHVIGKIYCASIPENTYAFREGIFRTYLGLVFLPLHWLLSKKIFWTRQKRVDVNFAVVDERHFRRWFALVYESLPGTKRLSPRAPVTIPGQETTAPVESAVCLGDWLRLLLLGPLFLPALLLLRWSSGLDVFQAFRQALSVYSVFAAYFARYPCRSFVTFDDETNHPCRYLAFRQQCSGDFIVVQNGERIRHPHFAFGRMDRYLTFGPAYERIFTETGGQSPSFEYVGALYLNERYGMIREELARRPGISYDILFVDQGFLPWNGFDERSGRSIEAILRNLGTFQRRHPDIRITYQLRSYEGHPDRKEQVLGDLKRLFPDGLTLLANDGQGETYRNALRSNLVMTFESTFGFEAMLLGAKALFVNYSGDPAETVCEDERFQLTDGTADYDRFEKKVLGLLALELDGIPAVASARHHAFDGKVQERIVAALQDLGRSA